MRCTANSHLPIECDLGVKLIAPGHPGNGVKLYIAVQGGSLTCQQEVNSCKYPRHYGIAMVQHYPYHSILTLSFCALFILNPN